MSAELPRIIAALQLPPFNLGPRRSAAWYEDYLLSNARTFVDGGIRAIKVQDETREPGPARPETIARMAALGRAFRATFPNVALGIIVQAHDALAPLSIAAAVDAAFVRLKIFVGAAVNAEGLRTALGPEAIDARAALGAHGIRILADVHDRTSVPAAPVPDDRAALWAQSMGADSLVITGSAFADTLARIEAARGAGVKRPVYIGGGVDDGNVAGALAKADGVIVSTSLRRKGAGPDDFTQWDVDAVRRLVDAAGGP